MENSREGCFDNINKNTDLNDHEIEDQNKISEQIEPATNLASSSLNIKTKNENMILIDLENIPNSLTNMELDTNIISEENTIDQEMEIDISDDELLIIVENAESSVCDNSFKENKNFYSVFSDPENDEIIQKVCTKKSNSDKDILSEKMDEPSKVLNIDHSLKKDSDSNNKVCSKMLNSDKDIVGKKIDESSKDSEISESEEDLLGHHFNENGVLVDKNDKKFEYNVYNDKPKNQKRYESLGERITEHIYKLLVDVCELEKIYFDNDKSKSFFFASKNAFSTQDKLLILINGSGAVRAGQWARSVIINENLSMGSQIPYIQKAKLEGYEVVVLNTNHRGLRGPKIPEDHANFVWKNYINKCPAKHIGIVAHSYGGVVVTSLIKNYHDSFIKRIFAIAFTDSVHYSSNNKVNKFLSKKACNWVTSNKPLNTPISSRSESDAKLVSAGEMRHEWTSGTSIESVFKYFADMLQI